jgi:hypothetical protein
MMNKFTFGNANVKGVYFDEENRRHLNTIRLAYAQAAINFTSNISGTGAFASVTPQPQVWSIFKCTGGSCAPQPPATSVPAPLPILGIGATFAYSRRMRQRIAAHRG